MVEEKQATLERIRADNERRSDAPVAALKVEIGFATMDIGSTIALAPVVTAERSRRPAGCAEPLIDVAQGYRSRPSSV
jgi:hypothetical protein